MIGKILNSIYQNFLKKACLISIKLIIWHIMNFDQQAAARAHSDKTRQDKTRQDKTRQDKTSM